MPLAKFERDAMINKVFIVLCNFVISNRNAKHQSILYHQRSKNLSTTIIVSVKIEANSEANSMSYIPLLIQIIPNLREISRHRDLFSIYKNYKFLQLMRVCFTWNLSEMHRLLRELSAHEMCY